MKNYETTMKLNKANLSKDKLTKTDVIKILHNKQYKKVYCDFRYTDDYIQDYVNNYSEGLIPDITELIQDIIKYNLWNLRYDKKAQKVTVATHSNLSYTIEL